MWLAEKAGNLYHHPYDLGVYHNIVSVRTLSVTSLYTYRKHLSTEVCSHAVMQMPCQ